MIEEFLLHLSFLETKRFLWQMRVCADLWVLWGRRGMIGPLEGLKGPH